MAVENQLGTTALIDALVSAGFAHPDAKHISELLMCGATPNNALVIRCHDKATEKTNQIHFGFMPGGAAHWKDREIAAHASTEGESVLDRVAAPVVKAHPLDATVLALAGLGHHPIMAYQLAKYLADGANRQVAQGLVIALVPAQVAFAVKGHVMLADGSPLSQQENELAFRGLAKTIRLIALRRAKKQNLA